MDRYRRRSRRILRVRDYLGHLMGGMGEIAQSHIAPCVRLTTGWCRESPLEREIVNLMGRWNQVKTAFDALVCTLQSNAPDRCAVGSMYSLRITPLWNTIGRGLQPYTSAITAISGAPAAFALPPRLGCITACAMRTHAFPWERTGRRADMSGYGIDLDWNGAGQPWQVNPTRAADQQRDRRLVPSINRLGKLSMGMAECSICISYSG